MFKTFVITGVILTSFLFLYYFSPYLFKESAPTTFEDSRNLQAILAEQKMNEFFVYRHNDGESDWYISKSRINGEGFDTFEKFSSEKIISDFIIAKKYYKQNEWWSVDGDSYCVAILEDKNKEKYKINIPCP